MRGVNTDAETQAVFARRRRPAADQIFLRAKRDGIPRLKFGVVDVEVVVVVGERHENFRAVVLVEFHQRVGIEMLRFPDVDHVLETVGRGMAVFGDVRFVVAAALLIHAARIPIAVLRLALRAPMRPDAELRVAKPLRRGLVIGE